jgi:predicted nucleic acid-binding protein
MVVFYVETNFLMSIATGRELEATELLSNLPAQISLTTPQICIMESLAVLQQERRQRKSFANLLDQHIRQLERDTTSSHAATLRTLLNGARIENNELFADISTRLFDAIELMSQRAELIGLTAHVLEANRKDALIEDPTDNLILHCILDHARAHPKVAKAFMSNNRKDFGTKPVQDALQAAGIGKYVVETNQFLGWHRSQPSF